MIGQSLQEAVDISRSANLELMQFVNGGLRLQAAGTSALHHLIQAHPDGQFFSQFMDGKRCRVSPAGAMPKSWSDGQVLLLEHDWSLALAATKEEAVDFRPPFSSQIFETKISDKRICAHVHIELSGQITCVCFIWLSSAWVMLPLYDLNVGIIPDSPPSFHDIQWSQKYLHPIYDRVISQIRGACIALDASIATTHLVSASPEIKKARVASKKKPPFDFHILTLRGRTDGTRQAEADPTGTKVRLHFRRGHYRHFSDLSKTWINWTLVGDPDLGFIDKHYRLKK